jgi:hypothetical protein
VLAEKLAGGGSAVHVSAHQLHADFEAHLADSRWLILTFTTILLYQLVVRKSHSQKAYFDPTTYTSRVSPLGLNDSPVHPNPASLQPSEIVASDSISLDAAATDSIRGTMTSFFFASGLRLLGRAMRGRGTSVDVARLRDVLGLVLSRGGLDGLSLRLSIRSGW